MTFLQAIQQATADADIHKLSFANIKEFNSFLDSFNFSDFPVNVVVPFEDNGIHTNGRRKSTIPLQGWILTRVREEPLDLRSLKAEHDYIEPMRALAKQFLSRLLDTDLIDPEVQNVPDKIRPEYAFLSAHLFGVSYNMNVPISETIC